MRFFILILLFALLVISQINTIVDIDLWWNLKTGEYIVKNCSLPRTDLFSYSLENPAWINQEWLSQIVLYFVFAKFGWLGLNILKALIISLCFFVLLFFVFSKYKNIIFSIFCILLAILAFGYRSFVRPELFSYLLLCVFLYILESEKRLYLLPILQILWVNSHSYFVAGPILVFLYCIGEFLDGDRVKAKRLTVIFLFSLLACLINPDFYKGAIYPIQILSDLCGAQRAYMQNIEELTMPIGSDFGRYFFFWVFVIFTSATFFINLKNGRIKHILLFLASFVSSYIALRNAPFFIFIGMFLASMNLNGAFVAKNIRERKYCYVLLLLICATAYFFISDEYYRFTRQFPLKKTGPRFSELLMPKGACDFLEKNNIQGRMFNTLDFGPYIGYRFYPEKRVFIDSRVIGIYRSNFYELYERAQNYPNDWNDIQKKYNFDIVLLRHLFSGTERLLKYLYYSREWVLVYYDRNSAVFLRNAPKNSEMIEKFKIDFTKGKPLDSDIDINTAGFFEKIGEIKFAEQTYTRLLERDPKNLEAGNNLAGIYIKSGRFGEALKLIKGFLEYYPKSAELYGNMGITYVLMGKMDEGLGILEKSAKINPYLRQVAYVLGIIYLEKGDMEKAERQFVKYLRLDPYDAGVHRILGNIYIKKGLSKEAIAEYNEAGKLEGQ